MGTIITPAAAPRLPLRVTGPPSTGLWNVEAFPAGIPGFANVQFGLDQIYHRTDTTEPYTYDDTPQTAGTGFHWADASAHNSAGVQLVRNTMWFWEGAAPPAPSPLPIFPANAVWNRPIASAPLHANNALWMDVINGHTGHNLHQEFGGALYQGRYVGIPVNIFACNSHALKTITLTNYASESDASSPMTLRIPDAVIIEGDPDVFDPSGDNHLLLLDTDTNFLHEFFGMQRNAPVAGEYTAKQYSKWDLTSNALRTDTWTSADAAGLPIAPIQVRYDEAVYAAYTGSSIPHALRFTLDLTHGPYLWPARHDANSGGTDNPPFGMRVRLKSSFDVSSYSPINQAILRTLKQYGMLMADNGGDWFITGDYDSRWNDADLNNLRAIVPDGNFEVVDTITWQVSANSAQASN